MDWIFHKECSLQIIQEISQAKEEKTEKHVLLSSFFEGVIDATSPILATLSLWLTTSKGTKRRRVILLTELFTYVVKM